MRILLVEDDRKVGSFLAMGLGEEGHAVTWVEDGDAALAQAIEGDHQAILLDYMLPRRSGLEVARELRRMGRQTPILMLTAHDAPEEMRRSIEAGVNDFMVKPFRFGELLSRLNRLIAQGPESV